MDVGLINLGSVDVCILALTGLCTIWAVINAFISVSVDRKMICIYDIEDLSGWVWWSFCMHLCVCVLA